MLLSGKQPVQTAQRGDLIGKEIPKKFSSEMPPELSYYSWKKAVLPKEHETLVTMPGKVSVTPAEACPVSTPPCPVRSPNWIPDVQKQARK